MVDVPPLIHLPWVSHFLEHFEMRLATGDKDSATPLYVQEMVECMGSALFQRQKTWLWNTVWKVFLYVDLVFLMHCICHQLCCDVMIHYGLFSGRGSMQLATFIVCLVQKLSVFTDSWRSSCWSSCMDRVIIITTTFLQRSEAPHRTSGTQKAAKVKVWCKCSILSHPISGRFRKTWCSTSFYPLCVQQGWWKLSVCE